ncbi:DUF368 domain-containing protein [Halalkalibacillus sediminis]|uniref:DUF368 domain-containing protein n=1 Tax=Halalkalibacillus sediminis TaxID=2018042 RepID=A0A2I0QRT7_9BACI|nr:DUF368 domain-containing protein [Halalkalibacillus sediminis]PKR77043.1 DUF368 domain-containing protein [Halalkalibacillus sediminis]
MIEWKNLYRGAIMGTSDAIPGVSGGTIAVVLGIYPQLIDGITGIFTKDWKKHLAFLLPLFVGVLLALAAFANAMEWLLEHYPNQVQFVFLGLIVGIIPMLARESDYKKTFNKSHYAILILAVLLVASMGFFNESSASAIDEFSATTYILLFLSGMMASSAMVLPGISGSFLLLLVGMYPTFIESISNFVIDALIPLGLGIVVGLLVMGRIVKFFLDNYFYKTYALILGLVIGSLYVVYPGFESDTMLNVLSVVCLAGGLLAAYLLGKLEYQN